MRTDTFNWWLQKTKICKYKKKRKNQYLVRENTPLLQIIHSSNNILIMGSKMIIIKRVKSKLTHKLNRIESNSNSILPLLVVMLWRVWLGISLRYRLRLISNFRIIWTLLLMKPIDLKILLVLKSHFMNTMINCMI